MLISIVITAYNVEDYIEQAIKSALEQKTNTEHYGAFETEIIVVDDYSTDNTMNIVNRIHTEEHQAFKIIKSGDKNVGAGAARKAGIKVSNGDYVMLLDGDDWLETDYLSKLVDTAIKTDADIVSGGIIINKPNDVVETYTYGECELTGEDKVTRFFGERVVIMNNKIIKKHLHEKIPYCERRFIEDTQVIIPQLYLANKVVYVNCAGYHYRMLDTSLTHTASPLKYNVYRALCLKDLMTFFYNKPKGGWTDIVNFNTMFKLVTDVIYSNPSKDEILKLGPDALKDWLDFSLIAFETMNVFAKLKQQENIVKNNNI